ncbi:Retrovirus-related Pol polyprotein from type-1 retrotransposable element R2 (Fragment) [Anthophora plagiata]
MSCNEDEISDIGGPGPGPPVADLSAVDRRITNDDPGTPLVHDLAQIVDLPLSGQIKCKGCECKGLNRQFLQEAQFQKHANEQHTQLKIIWRCSACQKGFPKLHGCRCHILKCKGMKPTESRSKIKCDKCDEMFETRRGVSMHERHRHPELRNLRRIESQASQSRNRPSNRASAWSQEEVGLLAQLNERFKHLKQPNVAIREFLPGKTLKQISDKRRLLPVREQEAPAEADSSTESSSEEYYSAGEVEIIDEIPWRDLPNEVWMEPLREAILTGQLDEDNEFKEIENEMHELAKKEDITENKMCAIVQKFTILLLQNEQNCLNTRNNKKETNKRANRNSNGKKQNQKTKRKEYEYARYQELYKKCPKKLLDLAIIGRDIFEKESVEPPCKSDVEPLYNNLWGKTGTITNIIKDTVEKETAIKIEEVWVPIGVEEVINKFKRIKAKTAAGADGIEKSHLRKSGALFISTKLCNLLMMNRVYPEQWKVNRTTLIPKPGKSVDEVANWRPITIGSLLGRLYSAMIDKHLRAKTTQNLRQKGFTKEDGCKYNIIIFNSALANMKGREGGIITIIDISKAFDTVPHGILCDALEAKGIPAAVGNYIKEMYNGCRTQIHCKNNEIVDVALRRGVKQGDPLSPLLFYLIIDPIIGKIEETSEGVKIGDENVSILAFADDLVLLAKNGEEAQNQVKKISIATWENLIWK